MHNCPNCGQEFRIGMIRCGCCNFKLPEILEVDTTPTTAERKMILCWNCRHSTPEDALRCEICNAKQEKAPSMRIQRRA